MSTKKHDDDAPKNEGANTASTNPAAPPAHPPGHMPSINEPEGSQTRPPPNEAAKKDPAAPSQTVTKPHENVSHETSELPPDAELERMTRADLDDLAEERGVDISQAHNKDDVIAALRKDARKRR
jgi:hypothetical protein